MCTYACSYCFANDAMENHELCVGCYGDLQAGIISFVGEPEEQEEPSDGYDYDRYY